MTATASTPVVSDAAPAPMSRRATLNAISGLILGMFVAILSGTVVSTSLPRIISDLGGDQSSYTWVVTAALLATTVTTPIWGKFADLVNRKMLVQLALGLFVLGSVLGGFAQDASMLIGFRVIQGLGAGGLLALVQIVIADIISPRERGRWMGLIGSVMAVATIGGPLIGGLVTDGIGWRANFFIALPFAIAAIALIQATLHLPDRPKRAIKVDYFGAVLIATGVSLLLIWVTLGGSWFEWNSIESFVMIGGAVLALVAAVVVELVVEEPIVPLSLFRNRTYALSVVASLSVGVAMFGTTIFLAQYMQLARGATPTESGLLTIPLIVGQMGSSIAAGQLISRYGRWKRYLVTGSVLAIAGLLLMSTLHYDTPYGFVALFMFVLGAGLGMVMQNLVLVVQNDTPAAQLGAASSGVAFFRSLGGTAGVAVMGAVLGTRVADLVREGLTGLAPEQLAGAQALADGGIPDLAELPGPVRTVVESAYGLGVAEVFLIAVPLAIVSLIAICFLPNKPLQTVTAAQRLAEEAEEAAVELADAELGVVAEDPRDAGHDGRAGRTPTA
ncbi:MDR family MFS transporter [Agromyces rhizosphaerae]|uniref:MDR family MFS transporter n=1 Tax=Agromyces rhizosphaerae TaxID=88374 RepID=UPI0035A2429B